MINVCNKALGLVATAIIVAACSSADLTDDDGGDGKSLAGLLTSETSEHPVTLSANVGNDSTATTKANYTIDGQLKVNYCWQLGDDVSMIGTTGKTIVSARLTADKAGTSTTFSGTTTAKENFLAVYPYNAKHTAALKADGTMNTDSITYYLPATYSYDKVSKVWEGSETNCRVPLIGKVTTLKNGESNASTLCETEFKHVGGLFTLIVKNLPAAEGWVKLSSGSGNICGKFIVKDADTDKPYIATRGKILDSAINYVLINYSNADTSQPGVFYFPLPTGTYDLTVSVGYYEETQDSKYGTVYCGKEWTSNVAKNVTISRAKLLQRNVTPTAYSANGHYRVKGSVDGVAHEMVDFGLVTADSARILFAASNMGAETEGDYGLHYSWGGLTAAENGGAGSYYDKSCETMPLSNDAAACSWGEAFHIPTNAEWNSLLINADITNVYATANNTAGFKVYRKSDPKTYIFLPEAGYVATGSGATADENDTGYYWSSSVSADGNNSSTTEACGVSFSYGRSPVVESAKPRVQARSIRPVALLKKTK